MDRFVYRANESTEPLPGSKPMKVIIISRSKRHTRTYYYLKKAFQQLGHRAIWLKYPRIRKYLGIKGADTVSGFIMKAFRPDMIFVHRSDISSSLLAKMKGRTKVVMYVDDCLRGLGKRQSEKQIALARHTDIFYLTNRGEIPIYQDQGVNAKFITGGCDPAAHYPVSSPPPFYRSDVAFIGKPSTPERLAFLRRVSENFNLKLWGSGWEAVGLKSQATDVYAAGYRRICAGAKIILGWNVDPTIDLYFSNRTWYTLGCGGFLLTAYSPNLEELFTQGVNLEWYNTEEECFEKIAYYLENDKKREEIASAGYKLAHSRYRFTHMAQKIIYDASL